MQWEKGKGPIFFYTGNEGNIETFAQNTGLMWDLAPKFHAMVVFAEHRCPSSAHHVMTWPEAARSFVPGFPFALIRPPDMSAELYHRRTKRHRCGCRYYGESNPVPMPESLDGVHPEAMQYLTTEQVLADFEKDMRYIRKEYDCDDCPIVAFGGSYG